jgi:hypothetical protein
MTAHPKEKRRDYTGALLRTASGWEARSEPTAFNGLKPRSRSTNCARFRKRRDPWGV